MRRKILLSAVYLLIGLAPAFVVSYAFGHHLLFGITQGNDFPYAFLYTKWLSYYFPKIPLWFPLHGGGQSFVQNAQVGVYYLSIFLDRLTSLTLVQAFRLWAFLSVPLTCLGIYLFVWYKLRSQTSALLAAFFYTLSQATWTWLYDTGLYAQSVSLPFVIPVVFSFDRFLSSQNQKRKIWLVITSISLAFLSIFHLASGLVTMEILFLYGLLWLILEGKDKFKFTGIIRVLSRALLVNILATLLMGFWFFPYLRYFNITNPGELLFPDLSAFPHFKIAGLLGILGPQQSQGAETAWYMFFATPVIILAVVGLIFAFKRSRLVIGWVMISLFFMFQTALPGYFSHLPSIVAKFWRIVTIRAIIPAMFFLPMAAGYGAEALSEYVLTPMKNIKFQRLLGAIKAILAIALSIGAIILFRHVPDGIRNYLGSDMGNYLGYGPAGFYRIIYEKGALGVFEGEIWAPLKISKDTGFYFGTLVKEINSRLELTPKDRVDIAPQWGGIIQAWSVFSDVPISTSYNIAGLPNLPIWNYQQTAFYNKDISATSREVNQLTKYFGIDYALFYEGYTPFERFDESWQEVIEGYEALRIFRFQNPTGVIEITDKPRILVIGSSEKHVYETIFRLANAGILDYEDAVLVWGKDDIGKYSLEELKNFDALFMYGYSYKNKEKSLSIIDNYVREGGNLFIETGWQYVNPDWQMDSTPEFIPVEKTVWENFDSWDLEGFSPPSYKDGPWGASVGKNLKSWAEPVLTANGKTLVARGSFGRGKVFWSGMNLPGHAYIYKNEKEYQFMKESFSWLLPLGGDIKVEAEIKREYPDRVEFGFSPTDGNQYLYFKENFFPDWKAQVQISHGLQKTNVYRAGAGHMLIKLPNGTTRLILKYRPSSVSVISKIVSLLTFGGLVFWMFWKKPIFKGGVFGKTIRGKINKWWDTEDEI